MMMLLKLWSLLLLLPPSVAELRIMINYREDSFIQEALEYAIENIIDANITSRNILTITVRDSGILEEIQNNVNVEYAEVDNIMAPLIQGKLRERKFLDGDGEIQPYGISMVQADQVWDIPEVQDDLLVCVVDTGMFLGHPVSIHFGGHDMIRLLSVSNMPAFFFYLLLGSAHTSGR
jgi:hypothetical protein